MDKELLEASIKVLKASCKQIDIINSKMEELLESLAATIKNLEQN